MNSILVIAVLATLAVAIQAGDLGHGVVVSGPSGIVTPHGPIGPHALGLGHGLGHGLGYGLGWGGWGAGGWGAGAHGLLGHGGVVGYGAHGVAVKGPATVPAVIAGPAGKIVADGLYGVPTHGHWGNWGHWGHHW